jgi:hypothetical protein
MKDSKPSSGVAHLFKKKKNRLRVEDTNETEKSRPYTSAALCQPVRFANLMAGKYLYSVNHGGSHPQGPAWGLHACYWLASQPPLRPSGQSAVQDKRYVGPRPRLQRAPSAGLQQICRFLLDFCHHTKCISDAEKDKNGQNDHKPVFVSKSL